MQLWMSLMDYLSLHHGGPVESGYCPPWITGACTTECLWSQGIALRGLFEPAPRRSCGVRVLPSVESWWAQAHLVIIEYSHDKSSITISALDIMDQC